MALRGYAGWNPKPETALWIRRVQGVLAQYEDYLPLSLRTVFYILVQQHGFEKSEKAYNRLGTWVARARRAQLLGFDGLKDDQGRAHRVLAWSGVAGFWGDVDKRFEHYRRRRLDGQPVRAEVWTEASGIGEQLQRVAWRYGIPVYISRGFTSVTNAHAVAERAMEFDGPTVLFHVGDYDPSGLSIYESLTEDARAFLIQKRAWEDEDFAEDGKLSYAKMDESGPTIQPVRVALTWEQVEEHGVETAPPKPTDSRSASWVGETAQAEALPPDLLEQIVTEAIEAELDLEVWEEQVAAEETDRDQIGAVLEQVEIAREEEE